MMRQKQHLSTYRYLDYADEPEASDMAAFERGYLASHERCGREALAPRKARQLFQYFTIRMS